MDRLHVGSPVVGALAAVGMLAGCGGIGAPTSMPPASIAQNVAHRASSSGSCPSLQGSTGILPDGDFSLAVDPPTLGNDDKKGTVFAPNCR